MTVPVWPSQLPKPTRPGYQASPQEARIRRNAETGPPGFRRRFSSTARMVTLSFICSRFQKGYFDQFFDETLQKGSLPFWMPDPVTDGWQLLTEDGTPLTTEDGTPLLISANWLCLITEPPSEAIYGQLEFEIAFQVAVLP